MHHKPKPSSQNQQSRSAILPLPRRAKTPLFLLAASLLVCIAPFAKAIAPMGDDAELFVTGVATVSENDNIFLSHTNATSSTILDLIPGLSYEFGKKDALTTGQFAYNEDFQMFSKSGNQLDYQLANVTFWVKYDDSANKFNFDASFHQADQAEVGLQNVPYLVERDLYHVDGTDEINLTEKSSVSAGAAFDDTHYQAAGYVDYYYTEVPVNVYLKVEPKLDLSAGFRYRDNELGTGGISSDDYYYNVGARGEFTPNLTGQFTVGYQQEKFDNGLTYGGLGIDSNFTYSVDPKTSVTFGVNDDFSYVATGAAIRSVGVTLGFNSAISDQWSINGQVGYSNYSYIATTQRDNYYSGRLGLSYIVNTHLTLSATYTYAQDQSNVLADSFTNNIVSISGSLRF